jgi:hypothetical protein
MIISKLSFLDSFELVLLKSIDGIFLSLSSYVIDFTTFSDFIDLKCMGVTLFLIPLNPLREVTSISI